VSEPGTKPDSLLYMRYRVTRLCSPPLVPQVAGMDPDRALLLRPLHSQRRACQCQHESGSQVLCLDCSSSAVHVWWHPTAVP